MMYEPGGGEWTTLALLLRTASRIFRLFAQVKMTNPGGNPWFVGPREVLNFQQPDKNHRLGAAPRDEWDLACSGSKNGSVLLNTTTPTIDSSSAFHFTAGFGTRCIRRAPHEKIRS